MTSSKSFSCCFWLPNKILTPANNFPVSGYPPDFSLVSAYGNNSHKQTAPLTDTFFNSRGCPLTRELTVFVSWSCSHLTITICCYSHIQDIQYDHSRWGSWITRGFHIRKWLGLAWQDERYDHNNKLVTRVPPYWSSKLLLRNCVCLFVLIVVFRKSCWFVSTGARGLGSFRYMLHLRPSCIPLSSFAGADRAVRGSLHYQTQLVV